MRRTLAAAACAGLAVSTVLLAAPAQAEDDDPLPTEAEAEFTLLDEDDEFYDPYESEGCGTVLTYSFGDVREGEVREYVTADGATVEEFRGSVTVDVTAADGRAVDEVDVSGYSQTVEAEDGSTSYLYEGPTIFQAFPGEEAAYQAAGLPLQLYAAGGYLEFVTGPEGAGAEFLAVPEGVADVCGFLDGAEVPSAPEEDADAGEPPAGYSPLPQDDPYYTAGFSVADCGTILALTSGDVREVETSTVVEDDGDVVVRYRGAGTVDVRDVGSGALVDELDVSGRSLEVYREDGTATVRLYGPSIFLQLPQSEAAFAEAGLPPSFFYDDADDYVEYDVDEDGETTVTEAPTEFVTVCDLFEE